MKHLSVCAFFLFSVFGFVANAAPPFPTPGNPNMIPGWVFVYEHDANGVAIDGSLEDLIAAIHSAQT